ncbi:hypothetical protein SAMD00019534_048510 [Acytostelium subglobosum LB1]|uniref:hypothetical protein n=1 Tax=Acytostelium subglobosum LB1 TaxID=1410327 RepID=UPI000644F4FB|nr:hypothetical protein SAMD00019534_048510 [Acytostelium subglobosum LB1]GAM21676.1 hypothetical protein SAMD00019534_048510 [Acytostelium subglobosum LB1]|eukprot:XP_012755795.1 hypothetical protein SAMD00019534_048510 [Acytostelium subglobosum LB1]
MMNGSNDITMTIEQVTRALEALHNPMSTSAIHQQSQAYLEEVKRSPNAYTCALAILTHRNEIVRHYGLHIIENLVKNQWVNASDAEKENVKNEMLSFVSKISASEQKFIKEKLVTVVVEIVKRDWPQRWANLLESLIQISSMGAPQAELVLLTLGQLPHEIIFDSTSTSMVGLSDQRKKDLMAGINQAITSLFSFFYTMLETRYTRYVQDNNDTVNANLISTLLSTLHSYIEWVPVTLILQHKLDFIFCQLLKDLPFRVKAAEALLLFVSRRVGRPEEKAELLTVFNMLDRIVEAMGVTTSNHEADYVFHKRLAQMLTVLGTTHLGLPPKEGPPSPLPPNYHIYLQLMTQLLNHPSILLTSLALPFWSSLLKSTETVGQIQSFFEPLTNELLNISQTKLLKVGDPAKGDQTPQSKYSAIDFGTSREWGNFYGTVRNRFVDVIKQLTSIRNEQAFNFGYNKVMELIPNIKTNVTLTHEQTMILESISFFLEIIVGSLSSDFYHKDTKYPQCTKTTESLLKTLWDSTFTDPNATSFQMDCIKPFTSYYSNHPESIQMLLTKIVPMIPFKSQADNAPELEGRLSNSSLHCRRRIISCLTNLSMNMTDCMMPFLPQLYQSVQQLFQNNLVTESERVMLYYMLTVLNNNISNYQKNSEFLRELITPVLTLWNSPEITAAVQSPEALVTYLGLLPSQASEDFSAVVARRKKLQFVVATLQIFWKKTTLPPTLQEEEGFIPFIANGISYTSKWPISSFVNNVLPNVVALAHTVHGLWNPTVINNVDSEYRVIFQLDEAITAPLLGLDYHKDNKTESSNIKFVRNLLDTMRDACYEIIGYGFTHADEMWSIATLPKILSDSVFSHLEVCENRHIKLISRHVLLFLLKYCPQKLQPQFFDALFPHLLSILFSRIKSGWEVINQRSQKEHNDSETEIMEIINDKILRDLTLEFTLWVKDFTLHPTIFKNPDIVSGLVYGLSACLLCTDHGIVNKATPISLQVIELIGDDPQYYKLIGSDMFGICLKVLIQNKVPDLLSDFIAVVRAIYVKLLGKSQYPNQVLSMLPNVNPTVLSQLEAEVTAAKTEKLQKATLKKVLDEVIGINMSKLKKQSILDLPEKLFVSKMAGESLLDSEQKNILPESFFS